MEKKNSLYVTKLDLKRLKLWFYSVLNPQELNHIYLVLKRQPLLPLKLFLISTLNYFAKWQN